MQRLATRFDFQAWYAAAHGDPRPVAWCSAFAPAEALLAAGVLPVYPENHAAMLGALSPTRDPERPYSRTALAVAAARGLRHPALCSYARSDLGVLLGAEGPLPAGLPPPDLFYSCDSQCWEVERWGEAVRELFAERGRDLPHYVLRTGFVLEGRKPTPEAVSAVAEQLRGHLEDLGARFGAWFDGERLRAVLAESARADRLWRDCLDASRARPSPWCMTEAFAAMAPMVIARGTTLCTDFYRRLRAELAGRTPPPQRRRLLWDGIPVWPRKRWLAERLAAHGAVLVASTYTHSWGFALDPARGLDGVAARYAWNTMNLPRSEVSTWLLGLVDDFAVDGVISHWNHGCPRWNGYVKANREACEGAGIPVCELSADMVDPERFDAAATATALDDFLAKS